MPSCPYVSLWSRLDGFAFDQLGDLVETRGAVRAVLMRGTIHLVSAADALQLWPAMRPVLEQVAYPNATYGMRGSWTVQRDEDAVTLSLTAFEPLSAAQRAELEAEASQLLAHTDPGLAHEVRFTTA